MGAPGLLDPFRPGDGIAPVDLRTLPPLALVDADGLVTAWVGGAAEPDLVPRPGVGVESGTGVAGPQRPDMTGGQAVIVVGVLHALDELGLLRPVQRGERAPEA